MAERAMSLNYNVSDVFVPDDEEWKLPSGAFRNAVVRYNRTPGTRAYNGALKDSLVSYRKTGIRWT